jgi:hypothetical protein
MKTKYINEYSACQRKWWSFPTETHNHVSLAKIEIGKCKINFKTFFSSISEIAAKTSCN